MKWDRDKLGLFCIHPTQLVLFLGLSFSLGFSSIIWGARIWLWVLVGLVAIGLGFKERLGKNLGIYILVMVIWGVIGTALGHLEYHKQQEVRSIITQGKGKIREISGVVDRIKKGRGASKGFEVWLRNVKVSPGKNFPSGWIIKVKLYEKDVPFGYRDIVSLSSEIVWTRESGKLWNVRYPVGKCIGAHNIRYRSGGWMARSVQGWNHYLESLSPVWGKIMTQFLQAALLGRKDKLPMYLKESFQNGGCIHLLALSGLHLWVIVACIFIVLFWLGVPFRWVPIIIMVLAWTYVGYTFGVGSLLRACLMLSIALGYRLLGWRCSLAQSLHMALWIQLIISPLYCIDIGTQMSFLALLGISCANNIRVLMRSLEGSWLKHIWGDKQSVWRVYIIGGMWINIWVSLWIFPLQAYIWGKVTWMSLCANMIIFPFFALVLYVGLVGTMILWIPWLHKLGGIVRWLVEHFFNIVYTIGQHGKVSEVSVSSAWVVMVYIGLLWIYIISLWRVWEQSEYKPRLKNSLEGDLEEEIQ